MMDAIMAYLAYAAYGVYLLIIIAGSAAAVFEKSLVRAFIGLIATLFGVAGMYLLLQSPFLAFMQLLIYIGAVAVLIFFAIMLTDSRSDGDEAGKLPAGKLCRAILAGVLPLVLLTPPIIMHPASGELVPTAVTIAEIGKNLMGDYVLAFELISVILLVAMAGGVFLAMDRTRRASPDADLGGTPGGEAPLTGRKK